MKSKRHSFVMATNTVYRIMLTFLFRMKKKSTICSTCSEAYGKTITKSLNCNWDSTKHEINHDPYIRTESKHTKKKPQMHVEEPCIVNPCLREVVYDVISHTQKLCSIGSEEEGDGQH